MSFPVLKITGGPHGHNVHLYLDGIELKGVVKFLVSGRGTDVVYLYTKQVVSLDVDMEVETPVVIMRESPQPESAVYAALNGMRADGRLCGCGHPAHPGLVCGWPTEGESRYDYDKTGHCGCEG